MKLNNTIIKNLYATLFCCHPFSRWNMPLPDEILFIVDDDTESLGTYQYDPGSETFEHIITISRAKCAFIITVLSTLAHEMIHMSRFRTSKWDKHDAEFRRRATMVGLELGLDHLEL